LLVPKQASKLRENEMDKKRKHILIRHIVELGLWSFDADNDNSIIVAVT